MSDPIIDQMAGELKQVVEAAGLDPANPPDDGNPPPERVFAEYKRRGGTVYTDADAATKAVVNRVVELAKEK